MNKTASTHIRSVLFFSMAVFILSGCGAVVLTSTPAPVLLTVMPLRITRTPQSLTPAPPYIHFTPSNAFKIYLEFDYPGSWVISKRRGLGIFLKDPRFSTLPTPSPDDSHPTPNDYGSVDIWVIPVEPGHTLDTEVEAYKQGHSGSSWIKTLDEYMIKIDGYDARVLEYQIDFTELYTSVMFERDIFFAVKDQIYQITFRVAEKERGGEFEKGYEYFFNSLKIAP